MGTASSVRIGSRWPWFVDYGNWLFKYRNAVFPLLMLVLFLGFRPRLAGGSLASDLWMDAVGFAVAMAGQALRAAVIGYAYIKRGGLNKKVHADRLVTEGFFAHARNPLYDGNLLILAGLFIIHNSPWVYLIGGAYFVTAYLAIVAAEETFLAGRFGDEYAGYCARVNRWWPRLRGLRATMQGMAFNWRRVLLKDYASACTWMIMALLLIGYERAVHGYGWAGGADGWLLGAAALLLVASVVLVRVLKKRRILHE
jgi:protein-S-isoprenylcysteine O-methyltransferase Ste14